MINKLIKLLGGYTREEYNLLSIERDAYKSNSDQMKGQLQQAEKYFEHIHQEGNTFKELFLNQMGLGVAAPREQVNNSQPEPFRTAPINARQLMREMQEDDRKRAAAARNGQTGEPKIS